MAWRFRISFALLVFCSTTIAVADDALTKAGYRDTGLIQNSGFEQGTREGQIYLPAHWRKWVYVGEKHSAGLATTARSGRGCASILIPDAKDNISWLQTIKTARLPRSRRLAVVGYVRTKLTSGRAAFVIAPYRDDEPLKQIWSESVSGESDWQRVVVEFELPDGASHFTVSCKLAGTGQAWFDDVYLVYR